MHQQRGGESTWTSSRWRGSGPQNSDTYTSTYWSLWQSACLSSTFSSKWPTILWFIMTDNSTVVAQIRNQGGTHSRQLHHQTALLLSWADNHSVRLLPRHISGHLNVLADQLSRRHQVLNTEWTLAQPVLTHLWHLLGSTTRGHVCHSQQRQTTRVCLSTSRPPRHGG